MAKYQYTANLYTWSQESGKQHAYTLTGEVEAANHNAAECQAHYDVLIQRIGSDAHMTERTHVAPIQVKEVQ